MVRKLRDDGSGNGYPATGLVLVDWSGTGPVAVGEDRVPPDIGPGQFFAAVIRQGPAVPRVGLEPTLAVV